MKKNLTVIIFLLFLGNLHCYGETISDYIFKPKPITQSECEKIKDQYGITSCPVSNDYWAGAVKACGGIKNMPSEKDFHNIYNQIISPMLHYADSFYYTDYYYPINNKLFYTNVPYDRRIGVLFSDGYNKTYGVKISLNTKYISNENLKKINENFSEYRNREESKTFSVDMKNGFHLTKYSNPATVQEYNEQKIGKFNPLSIVYRNDKNNEDYAICKDKLLKYYGE